jgi:hypothetical protein
LLVPDLKLTGINPDPDTSKSSGSDGIRIHNNYKTRVAELKLLFLLVDGSGSDPKRFDSDPDPPKKLIPILIQSRIKKLI